MAQSSSQSSQTFGKNSEGKENVWKNNRVQPVIISVPHHAHIEESGQERRKTEKPIKMVSERSSKNKAGKKEVGAKYVKKQNEGGKIKEENTEILQLIFKLEENIENHEQSIQEFEENIANIENDNEKIESKIRKTEESIDEAEKKLEKTIVDVVKNMQKIKEITEIQNRSNDENGDEKKKIKNKKEDDKNEGKQSNEADNSPKKVGGSDNHETNKTGEEIAKGDEEKKTFKTNKADIMKHVNDIEKWRDEIKQQRIVVKEGREIIKGEMEILITQRKGIKELREKIKERRKCINKERKSIKEHRKNIEQTREGITQQKEDNTEQEKSVLKIPADDKGNGILMILTGTMVVFASLLVAWTDLTEKSDSCERKKALQSINASYPFECKYEGTEGNIKYLMYFGIVSLCIDSVFFFIVIILRRVNVTPENLQKHSKFKCGLHVVFAVFAVLSTALLLWKYSEVSDFKGKHEVTDYSVIKTAMLESLTTTYTSDDFSSFNTFSDSWNAFFIQYNCCAVNQVEGTTNDFDITPWCTTSGSCQQTNSQIPKTCCKGVTKANFQHAPSSCHASVTDGTYKDNCLDLVMSLSDVSTNENNIYELCTVAFTLGIIKIIAFAYAFNMIVVSILEIKAQQSEEATQQTTSGNQREIANHNTCN